MKKLKVLLPVFAYCALIFYLSSLSTIPESVANFPDKIAHVILYSGLGFLVARSISASYELKTTLVWTLTTGFCLLYGMSDEFHQYFVPGRSPEIGDVLADMAGGFVGGVVYTWMVRLRNSSSVSNRDAS